MPHRLKTLARHMDDARDEIVRRWLDRIIARVSLDRDIVFPSESLLDDVPLLIHGIARFLEGGREDISSMPEVVAKARELGRLRFHQAVSPRQILLEYEILGSIILQNLDSADIAGVLPEAFVRRLMQALSAVQRYTMEEYFSLAEQQAASREDQMRSFNRALSHELRNDTGAVLGAARMLREPFVLESGDQRDAFVSMIIENAERIERLVANLLQLTKLESDPRRNRHVLLHHAIDEVRRRLRNFSESNQVTIRVVGTVPEVEVSAAGVDLALTNLIANSIKYARQEQGERWVEITTERDGKGFVIVRVTDNGSGVPVEERGALFERFFRSERHADIEGTGLGLALVRETLERLGGKAWAEFPDSGNTIFAFTIPARRATDK